MANNQAELFLIFVLAGIIVGVLFDFFRILRRSFSTGNILTALEDIVFWILTGILFLYLTFAYNNGVMRGYMFLGMFCGTSLYLLTLSKFFIKINVSIINFIKKIVVFIIKPFKWIFVFLNFLVFRHILTIFKKFIEILKQYIIKLLKITKIHKKFKNKEGFYSNM